MDIIKLNCLVPNFLGNEKKIVSNIWNREVSFEKGKLYEVKARSGSGKSSLLSYLFGERKDYSGEIFFDHQLLTQVKEKEWKTIRGTNISFVFQDLRLFPDLNAVENIQIKNQLTKYKSPDQIMELLNLLGLKDKLDLPASMLSFGQQQRVAIVRALCQNFDFLLMDEPFSHLDEENINILCSLLNKEIEERGASLIVTSLGTRYPFEYHTTYLL